MKLNVTILAASAMAACLFACSTGGPPAETAPENQFTDADARAIVEKMNEEWDAHVLSGDFQAAATMYTEGAIRMQPGMPALEGRDAIRDWMKTEADTYTFEGSNEILEVRALSSDWILMRGAGSFTATPRAGGEARFRQEKWLTIVQRQADGSWKWFRDAGNQDISQ